MKNALGISSAVGIELVRKRVNYFARGKCYGRPTCAAELGHLAKVFMGGTPMLLAQAGRVGRFLAEIGCCAAARNKCGLDSFSWGCFFKI